MITVFISRVWVSEETSDAGGFTLLRSTQEENFTFEAEHNIQIHQIICNTIKNKYTTTKLTLLGQFGHTLTKEERTA